MDRKLLALFFLCGVLAGVVSMAPAVMPDTRPPKDAAICKQYHWLMANIYHERINDMERFCTEGGEP